MNEVTNVLMSQMSEELRVWCNAKGFPFMSADDLLSEHGERMTDAQRAYLQKYCARWEQYFERGSKAQRPVKQSSEATPTTSPMYAVKRGDEVCSILPEDRARKLADRLTAVNGRPHVVTVATPEDIAAWEQQRQRQ